MKNVDLIVIGAGPAGMAAALCVYEEGIRNILVLDRAEKPGGILQQCIHNGFGLHKFGEELTGPEYAAKYSEKIISSGIQCLFGTSVLSITKDKLVTAINNKSGMFTIQSKAIILAMGCRERSRGALGIPGSRPAGIYTAGTAQWFVNIKGEMPGKNVVILGSGDIGLIMARRLTLEGAKVQAVCELMPYSGGLNRNIVQCLNDFSIPLKLSHTISKIHGESRVTGVTVSKVDVNLNVIETESEYIPCDTILLSVGLIPENELTKGAGITLDSVTGGAVVNQNRQTETEGVFACGNVLHVHDLVDFVSEEAELAGKAAAEYIKGGKKEAYEKVVLRPGNGVRYTVPQIIEKNADNDEIKLYFRVGGIIENASVVMESEGETAFSKYRRKMVPGEMEYIVIKRDILEKMHGTVIIKVEQGAKK